jgi:hypothetical protein
MELPTQPAAAKRFQGGKLYRVKDIPPPLFKGTNGGTGLVWFREIFNMLRLPFY